MIFSPPCLCVLSFSYKDNSHSTEALPEIQDELIIFRSLITCAKTLFPNKITVRGSGGQELLADIWQPITSSALKLGMGEIHAGSDLLVPGAT